MLCMHPLPVTVYHCSREKLVLPSSSSVQNNIVVYFLQEQQTTQKESNGTANDIEVA